MLNRRQRLLSEEILNAFQGSFDPDAQLATAARVLAEDLQADLCMVNVQAGDPNSVLLQGTAGDAALWSGSGEAQELVSQVVKGGTPKCLVASGKGLPLPAGSVLSCALVHPVTWRGRPVASLIVGYASRKRVPGRVLRTVDALSRTLAVLIRGVTVRLYQTRKNEVAGELLRISESLSTSEDVQSCLSRLIRHASELTGAGGALLRISERGALRVRAFFTSDLAGSVPIDSPNDAALARRAYETGCTVIAGAEELERQFASSPVSRNLMCVPFDDGGGLAGVMTLFDRRQNGFPLDFGRLERETVRALIRVGLMAVYHIRKEREIRKMSRSLENRVMELTLLHRISRAALDRKEVTEVLRSLLESVTSVEGFGFDRAFLFLHESDAGVLRGLLGVEAFPNEAKEAEGKTAATRSIRHEMLDDMISGFAMPVSGEGGVLSRTVLERRSFRIRLPRDRDLVSREVLSYLGDVRSYATVPLVAENRVLGVIWVDNHRTARTIGHENFQLLVSAAAQAGLAAERSFQAEALDLLNSQLIDLQNRMIQWEKMAALGEMAASVAHDIRNPLVSIGGFTRRLRKMLPEDNRGLRYADIIINEVDRLERTLDNVMSYSRSYGVLDRKPVPLYALLSECAELFRENFKKKKVALQRQFSRDLPELTLDERQIKQAVLNILFNAGEAVAEESEVRLEARNEEGSGRVAIAITDCGEGIDPKDQELIFQPFFSTKSTGTGLGLAIAQRAVAGHGGEIRVDNRRGEGVTFTVYLPTVNPADQVRE